MKVSIIQSNISWESPQKNLYHFGNIIDKITEQTDLIILPEMFTTGFTMQTHKLTDYDSNTTLVWMRQQSIKKGCTITGSIAFKDSDKFYNRLYWIGANGSIQWYDKRHLFRMAGEDNHYTPGRGIITTMVDNWRIRPLICYDLRFPVWSRNRYKKIDGGVEAQYDVLVYVANWPQRRSYAWKQLLIARAIENQCYVIGVNRVGTDGNGVGHSGDSMVVSPSGEIISEAGANEETVLNVSLDRNLLDAFRAEFPVGLDADNFQLL